ncbi:hypothetical protein D6833_03215 [Candidatus Parcubacteria bacterium]|nr:MAG: hypothetical protein D6833_03215 [Candidatus Parcubacteria bacterium]
MYARIFGIDPATPWQSQRVQRQNVPDNLIPFMERPFGASDSTRYPIQSFIDHYWPLWRDPDDQLHRFDGRTFPFVIAGVSAYSSHQGIDYAMDGAEIYPVAEGIVYQEPDPLCGEVLVYHESLGILTQYMHMRDIQVTQGQRVYPFASPNRTVLGYASNVSSDRCPIFPDANGELPPHLHLSVVAGDLGTIAKWDYIEPFGWWGEGPDPLEDYDQGLWQSGSRWLWKGDKIAEDGEAQAELFHPLDEAYHWQRDPRGYQGDSWWNTTRTSDSGQIWGIWGTFFTEEEAGQYAVYATWPQDEQNTTQAHYYIYGNGVSGIQVSVDQRNQGSAGSGDFWYCLGSFHFEPGSAAVILRNWVEDPAEAGKRVYFDAVKWESGPCATPTPTPTPTPTFTPTPSDIVTAQVQIASGPEDAGPEPSVCAYATSWNEIYFGECANGPLITSGFRFGNVPVPQNAHIVEAYLEFTVDGPYDVPLQVRIYGEASGDAQPFSDTDRPENRPRTQTSVLWTIPADDHWELGMTRRTPDLTALVQDIVSRPDWQAYHGMGFIFETASSASGQHRRVIGYERPEWYPGSEYAARLVIRYVGTLPPTPAPTPTPTPGPCALQWMQGQGLGVQNLGLFYRVRSKLARTPGGERYVAMYYRYSPALVRLLQGDAEVRQAFGETLRLWQPVLQAWAQGQDVRLSHEQVVALQRFLKLLAERSEPSLRAAVVQEMQRIPWARLAGMRVSEVEALLLGEAPQRIPVPTGTPRP